MRNNEIKSSWVNPIDEKDSMLDLCKDVVSFEGE